MNCSKSHTRGNFLSHSIFNLILSGHSCVKIMPLFGYTVISGKPRGGKQASVPVSGTLFSMHYFMLPPNSLSPHLQEGNHMNYGIIVLHIRLCLERAY